MDRRSFVKSLGLGLGACAPPGCRSQPETSSPLRPSNFLILVTDDREFLEEFYPVLKGAVEFFLDFLVEHPRYGWLVTNPSTSPENFPGTEDNVRFFDEVTTFSSPGTSICAGSTIDMQIGQAGDLQEWLEDWPQREGSHRHISNLYGLYPGNQVSARRTPDLARGAGVVLDQRGLPGNGWASAWKMGCWARLYENRPGLWRISFTPSATTRLRVCSPSVRGPCRWMEHLVFPPP